MRKWRHFYPSLLALGLCIGNVDASPQLDLSNEELRWIAEHPVIRFSAESQLPPLEDVQDGHYTGLFASYLEAVAKRSGLKFELVPTRDWQHAQQLLLEGRIDMLSNAAPDRVSAEVLAAVSFSDPFYASPYIVIAPADAPIVFRRDQLRGKRVAFRSRGANELALASLVPEAKGIAYPDPESAMRAVAVGDADVLIGTEALYPPILRSRHVSTLGVAGMLDAPPYEAMYAIRRDQEALLSIMNKTLGTLTAEETDAFYHEDLAQADYGVPTWRAIARYRAIELELIALLVVLLALATVGALRSRRLARQSEAAKATFLATMSHEIRTPITTMVGVVEALGRDGSLGHEQRRMVAAASAAAEALTALLDNVLDLSKMDAARLELEHVPTDVLQLLYHIISAAEPGIRPKDLLVSIEAEGLGEPLMVDPTRLRQVVSNLVGNALKFTERGAVKIVACFDRPKGGAAGELSIEVADTGPGIPDDQQARLFQPYIQADQSTTRRYGGTGLGLAICRELIHLMRGKIELHSQVGVGTSVKIVIPVEPGIHQSHVPREIERPVMAQSGKEVRSAAVVLVAEDHEVNGQLICGQLASLGVVSHLVTNGRDAVEMIDRLHFDMVLMDCHMPGMDGYEAARGIRAAQGAKAHLPIIAVSSATDATHLQRCEASGMDGILRKPVKLTDLAGMFELWGLEFMSPAPPTDETALTTATEPSVHESLRADILAIAAGWLRGDVSAIEHHAHRLRGAALTCGLDELAAVATQLELAGADGRRPDLGMVIEAFALVE